MKIVFLLESLMLLFCVLTTLNCIYTFKLEKCRTIIGLVIYLSIFITCCFLRNDTFVSLHIIFYIMQIGLLKMCIYDVKFSSVIYTYTFLYSMNTIISLLIAIIFNIKHYSTLWIDFILYITVSIICIVLSFSKIRMKLQQIKNWTPIIAKRILLILLVLGMLLLSLIFDNTYYSNSEIWFEFVQNVVLLTIILLLIIAGFLICILLSNNQLKQLTANYEQQILAQAEHYKALAESNYELRRFKHDFKNMSIAIEKLLDSEEHKEALQLFQQYNHTLNHSNEFSVMYDTGNGIADALLADKQQKALACNCNIVFQGAIPLNYLMPTDICVILGNTLDNAIEACEKYKTTEPLTITVTCNCNSGFMFLSITNPISGKVNISNNYIATTKENKTLHGFGLYSLHSVVKKYDGKIELKSTDTTFTANIDLCLAN